MCSPEPGCTGLRDAWTRGARAPNSGSTPARALEIGSASAHQLLNPVLGQCLLVDTCDGIRCRHTSRLAPSQPNAAHCGPVPRLRRRSRCRPPTGRSSQIRSHRAFGANVVYDATAAARNASSPSRFPRSREQRYDLLGGSVTLVATAGEVSCVGSTPRRSSARILRHSFATIPAYATSSMR